MTARFADAIGLATLAALSLLPLPVVGFSVATGSVWLIGFLALAALGIVAWRSERWPATPGAALRLAALSAAAASVVLVLIVVVQSLRRPDLDPVDAALSGGAALALALALCPGLSAIAVAGAVRNGVALHRRR